MKVTVDLPFCILLNDGVYTVKIENQDIKRKVILMESEYRKKVRLDYPLLTDKNFYLYPEHVYSIEYYLLEAEAICKAFGNDDANMLDTIRNEIEQALKATRPGKFRPKSFLDQLCNKHFGSYDEVETPKQIARYISEDHIERFKEIVDLVKAITS